MISEAVSDWVAAGAASQQKSKAATGKSNNDFFT
jgi:hypothetical protein